MLIQSGLYYPYMHIRDATWLKAAALYWKRVDRIVPHDYPTHDSLTAQMLQDQLGFMVDRRPGQAAVDTSEYFIDLLTERGDELVNRLRVQPSIADLAQQHRRPRDGGLSSNGTIGYIFAEKLSSQLIEAMSAQGLAFGASDKHAGQRRVSAEIGSATWIGMDSRLAAAYMTVLSRLTARSFGLNPITDVPLAHTAMDGLTVDSIADSLIDQLPSESERQSRLQQRVARLAVETVIPRSLGLVGVDVIIAFRKAHENELGAFQAAVTSAANDLVSLPNDIEASALRDRVVEVTQQHLLKPQKELAASLRMFGLETIKSAMTLQLPVSAGAGTVVGAATTPVIGTAVGAAFVLGALIATEASRRRDLSNKSAAANYLLELKSGLTPTNVLRRRPLRSAGG
jgi:hypothetical protein